MKLIKVIHGSPAYLNRMSNNFKMISSYNDLYPKEHPEIKTKLKPLRTIIRNNKLEIYIEER